MLKSGNISIADIRANPDLLSKFYYPLNGTLLGATAGGLLEVGKIIYEEYNSDEGPAFPENTNEFLFNPLDNQLPGYHEF